MAIEKEFTGGGKTIAEGEHVVTITDWKIGESKSGKTMLTLTFENFEHQMIRGYYVAGLQFHEKALAKIKAACGLSKEAKAAELKGKSLGIAVEPQEPDERGRVFMRIVGYGKASDVSADGGRYEESRDNEIPF